METKRFGGSTVNVILTRQTCSQRSSRAAESKRRALGKDFPEWICYMFLMSTCRGDWDLGRCTFWVLAKREPLRNAKFQFFLRAKHVLFRKSPLRSGSLFASTQKVHRPRPQFPLHFDTGWLWLVGSLKLQVSFAKEPYKRDDILQKRPIILRSLLVVATPY